MAVRLALCATPICLAVLAGCLDSGPEDAGRGTDLVQVAGSETMHPVVAACAEEFMTKHEKADVIVNGGGSGDGIAALLHGIVDIGMTSRELSNRERDYARSTSSDLAVVPLALDGIAIIVNRANTIATLDLVQLRNIFTGRTRNWREVGGPEAEISVFARAESSGTASLFGERVLAGEPYTISAQRLPTNEAIVAAVAARSTAIGYTGLGALRTTGGRIGVVSLRVDAQSAPVSPTAEAIRARSYPLARTIYLIAAGAPTGTTKAFLDFCSGANGQALLQRAGYVGIEPATQE